MKGCPVCKNKGKTIHDQFREILYCGNDECPVIQYENFSITTELNMDIS